MCRRGLRVARPLWVGVAWQASPAQDTRLGEVREAVLRLENVVVQG